MNLFYIKTYYNGLPMGAIVEGKNPVDALTNFNKSQWVEFEGYEISPIEYLVDKNGNSSNDGGIKLRTKWSITYERSE